MKSRFSHLLTSHSGFLPFDRNGFFTSQCPFRRLMYAATGLTLTIMMASCSEKPSGSLQISNELMMILSKEVPLQQSAIDAVTSPASDFDKAILEATESSERYRAALSLEREMMANVRVADSVRRWQITGDSTVGGVREEGGAKSSKTTTGIAAGIQASQLIYDGGESVANINSATAKAVGAKVDRIIVGNEIALQAAHAWIDVWQYKEKLDLLNERSKEMETVVSQIERMTSNGMMDRAALDSVLRKVVAIKLEEARLKSDLSQAQVQFLRFFNAQPSELAMPAELVTMADARAQADTWQDAPDLQRSAVELIMAENAVLAAKAAFKPKAKFRAGVASPIQDGESTDTSAGLLLEYTFSDGGRRSSQLNAAEARMDSVKMNFLDVQRSFEAEIDATIEQLKAIELSMPLLARRIILSVAGAKTAKSQLATGQAKLNQVIEAQIESYRAEETHITTQSEQLKLQLSIASRTGLLGRLIGLPTDIAG